MPSPVRRTTLTIITIALGLSGCDPKPQPPAADGPGPASQVETVNYGHLRAYTADTTRPRDLVVMADLARALGADTAVRAFLAADPEPADFAPRYGALLDSAFRRLAESMPGLQARLGGWAQARLKTEAVVLFQLLAARSKPGPESHDAQQLIEKQGSKLAYGPELPLFARDDIGNVKERDFTNGKAIYLGAVVDTTSTHAAYKPLNIASNLSYCLYIGQQDGSWSGYLVVAPPNKECARSSPMANIGVPALKVYRAGLPGMGFGVGDVTESARWEWSPTKSINTIGIRCGDDWCRVTPQEADGFTAADLEPEPFVAPGTTLKQKKLKTGKGWNDWQVLGEIVDGTLKPLGPAALLYPHEDFDKLKQNSKFTTVAVANLEAAPMVGGKYDRMGLAAGDNWLELCGGTKAACEVDARKIDPQATLQDCTAKGNWHTRFTAAANGTAKRKYDCAVFTKETHTLPMPARWAFDSKDEGMWIRCPQGCCQVK